MKLSLNIKIYKLLIINLDFLLGNIYKPIYINKNPDFTIEFTVISKNEFL